MTWYRYENHPLNNFLIQKLLKFIVCQFETSFNQYTNGILLYIVFIYNGVEIFSAATVCLSQTYNCKAHI